MENQFKLKATHKGRESISKPRVKHPSIGLITFDLSNEYFVFYNV
jgi:hypothetical protein